MFAFSPKTGFKTKPPRRNKFTGGFIYLAAFMFLPKRPVLTLNLADGIFFWRIYFFAMVYVFPKTSWTTKPHRRGNFFGGSYLFAAPYAFSPRKTGLELNLAGGIISPGDLFICLRLCFCRKTGFKPKRPRRSKFPGGLINFPWLMFPPRKKTGFSKINIFGGVNFRKGGGSWNINPGK